MRSRFRAGRAILLEMEREGAQSSLHRRLMSTLARGARVQQDSRALIDTTRAIDDGLRTTLAEARSTRKQSARVRGVRIRTRR